MQVATGSFKNLRKRLFKFTRRRLLVGLAAVVVYALVMFPLGCGRLLANKVMLFPSTGVVPTYGATERTIETPAGDVQVFVARSTSAIGRPAERYVLYLMGNGSRAEHHATETAARWDDVPTEVWAMNYPGYGASPGPATLDKLAPAGRAVYESMAEAADDASLYLDCDSMGCTVGLYLAAAMRSERPVAGLVMKNPPPLRELVMGRFGWWNLWLVAGPVAAGVPGELSATTNAAQSHAPAVFIRAGGDSLVPPDYQARVFEAYAGRKQLVVLDGAEHNTPLSSEDEAAVREAMGELFR